MISSYDVKRAYIKLYSELSNYMWDYSFVCCLVDLEDAALKRFPNMTVLRSKFNQLYSAASEVAREDEDLRQAMLDFKQLIENNDCEFAAVTVNIAQ